MKIMQLESSHVTAIDKYFSENNNKIDSLIESLEIVNKNIKDLKTNLAYAYARIVILEAKDAEK